MVMGNFGDQYGEAHFNQMGICGIAVRKCMKGLSCLLGWWVGSGRGRECGATWQRVLHNGQYRNNL